LGKLTVPTLPVLKPPKIDRRLEEIGPGRRPEQELARSDLSPPLALQLSAAPVQTGARSGRRPLSPRPRYLLIPSLFDICGGFRHNFDGLVIIFDTGGLPVFLFITSLIGFRFLTGANQKRFHLRASNE